MHLILLFYVCSLARIFSLIELVSKIQFTQSATETVPVFFAKYFEENKPSSFHLRTRQFQTTVKDAELNTSLTEWLELDAFEDAGEDDIAALFVFSSDGHNYDTMPPFPLQNPMPSYVYKPVDRKVKPVPGVFPEDARVIRNIPENPLDTLPPLPKSPPNFIPTAKISEELLKEINIDKDNLLTSEEKKITYPHLGPQ